MGGHPWGLDLSREAVSHCTSCFWIPAPLWVCVSVCVCVRVRVCVCACVLIFFMEKWTKKIEREVFNCNKLAPCGPALSVCVSVHLRCGERMWGLCRTPLVQGLSYCVGGCMEVPAILYCPVPSLLAGWME